MQVINILDLTLIEFLTLIFDIEFFTGFLFGSSITCAILFLLIIINMNKD